MALSIPSYTTPYSSTPSTDAYAWSSNIAVDFASGNGRVTVNVHPDEASANAGLPPIDQIGVTLGEVLVPANGDTPAITFPDLTGLIAEAAQAVVDEPSLTPFDAIRQVIYTNLKNHPKLEGSTDV